MGVGRDDLKTLPVGRAPAGGAPAPAAPTGGALVGEAAPPGGLLPLPLFLTTRLVGGSSPAAMACRVPRAEFLEGGFEFELRLRDGLLFALGAFALWLLPGGTLPLPLPLPLRALWAVGDGLDGGKLGEGLVG